MKVLHVIDGFNDGGAERLLGCLAGSGTGVEMEVASLAPPGAGTAAQADLLAGAGLRPSWIGVRRLLEPGAVRKVRTTIETSGCDVVHAHLEYSTLLTARAVARDRHPFVATMHHTVSPSAPRRERMKERWAFRTGGRAGTLLFVSDASLRAAERLYGRGRDWRVVHNGVDITGFAPAPGRDRTLPAELGVPAGAPVVVMVAALRPPKGHRTAFDAWPLVRRENPDATLLVVGDGPAGPELRSTAPPGVVFAGLRSDVAGILAGSTLALQTSLTEALPTAMIEAGAAGLPAVATDVGGTREVVLHDDTGILIPPGDPAAVAAEVLALLRDPGRRSRLGGNARRRATERFDHRAWGRRLAELYDERAAAARCRTGAGGPR